MDEYATPALPLVCGDVLSVAVFTREPLMNVRRVVVEDPLASSLNVSLVAIVAEKVASVEGEPVVNFTVSQFDAPLEPQTTR